MPNLIEESVEHNKQGQTKIPSKAKSKQHYVKINIENFLARQANNKSKPDAVAIDAITQGNIQNDSLAELLQLDLSASVNHFVRWLLKLDEAARTEWQS